MTLLVATPQRLAATGPALSGLFFKFDIKIDDSQQQVSSVDSKPSTRSTRRDTLLSVSVFILVSAQIAVAIVDSAPLPQDTPQLYRPLRVPWTLGLYQPL